MVHGEATVDRLRELLGFLFGGEGAGYWQLLLYVYSSIGVLGGVCDQPLPPPQEGEPSLLQMIKIRAELI